MHLLAAHGLVDGCRLILVDGILAHGGHVLRHLRLLGIYHAAHMLGDAACHVTGFLTHALDELRTCIDGILVSVLVTRSELEDATPQSALVNGLLNIRAKAGIDSRTGKTIAGSNMITGIADACEACYTFPLVEALARIVGKSSKSCHNSFPFYNLYDKHRFFSS